MAALLVFAVVLAIVVYLFNKSRKEPNVIENLPFISGLPLAWAYLRQKDYDTIGDLTAKVAKGHDIYVTKLGSIMQVNISNPDYAKDLLMESVDIARKFEYTNGGILTRFFGFGLPFSNGDRWKIFRSLANSAFNQALNPEIVGETMMDFFTLMEESYVSVGKQVNIHRSMQRLTIEVLGKLAFGYRFGCFDSEETPHLISLYTLIMSTIESPYQNIFPWISNLPLDVNRKFHAAVEEFDEFIYDIIRKKRKEIANQQESKNDLLTTILQISEKEGINVTMQQLRDEMIDYFVAGHEAPSTALSTSFYYLAKHPELQDKARQEVINILGNEPVIPTSEQLKEMKYIHAIVKESLRIHPPTPIITFRKLSKEIKVGPYTLPKDTFCSVNSWQIHHDSRYWENPKQYNPERFLVNEKRNPYTWIGFSAGPRNCVGQNFATMEHKVVLSMMLLKYNWTLPENSINKEKLLLAPNFLVLKPVELKLNFEKRI